VDTLVSSDHSVTVQPSKIIMKTRIAKWPAL